ncbi:MULTISPECIES: NAD(P)-dependent oxidoreductase [Leuconostoc]|uniref:D-lactate dehydrogenase n=2 Tax=Leuconostoc kimchii TaxID=136609 RepID=D5T2H1_LEUKI|nr:MULTISPECIES: NAD(P)-dependent oxidoreductase [Leuconostoc]ADG40470.1 D-lactate dehydrogenase [Leuconostoc kimchii IMSNU 11154]AEJ31605.1 D-lactate dehydrogenase [Leuconostoc sp. C2]QBR46943.1 lactate dehydrogenase [Leuconostoc kimchii]
MFKITAYGVRENEVAYFRKLNIFNYDLNLIPENLTQSNIGTAKGSDGILLRANNDGSEPVLRQLKDWGIKYVFTRTVGYDHIDLEAAAKLGIIVARVPAYSPYAVADLAMNLGITLVRRTAIATSRAALADFKIETDLFGREIHDLTIGIIGTGKIGLAEAKLYKGLGAKVVGYDVFESDVAKGILTFVSQDELLKMSDIVSLHVPHFPNKNDHFFNDQVISKMKKGAILVNTSRAEITDQSAIIQAIKSGHLGGFGADVVLREKEIFGHQFDENHILKDEEVTELLDLYPKVLLTPHIGSYTEEALTDMINISYQNFNDVLIKGTTVNQVALTSA